MKRLRSSQVDVDRKQRAPVASSPPVGAAGRGAVADLLAERFPPLARYCPNLASVSAPQAAFLLLDCLEALYGGAAGGGKSDALLMAALQYVDVPGYAALLLRRTYAELEKSDGLIPRADSWLSGTDAKRGDGGRLWTFPSGARLEFGHVKDEADRFNYQSAAYQFVGFDELTSFTELIYDYIGFTRSRRKTTGRIANVPIRVRGASNPGNVGHIWVKQRYVDAKTRKRGARFVPAKVSDNPGLDVAEYRATMAGLPAELQAQLLEGDWDAFEGAAYTVTDAHLVDAFPLTDSIERFEAADYGLNGAPWALFAVDYEGNLICIDMLYEKDLLPSQLAPLVVARRKAGWGFSRRAVYMDPSVWHRTGQVNKWGAPAMLADEFTANGVPILPATNDPRAGMMRVRELLNLDAEHPFPPWHPRAGEKGAPYLFFVRGATGRLVEELRAAPLQPIDKRDGGEIVDPNWESRHGHAAAMCRYAALVKPRPSERPREPLASYRDELVRRLVEQQERSARPSFEVV